MRTKAVIDHFGSRSKVAKTLGLTYQAVHAWGEVVPPLQAARISQITLGALPFDPAEYADWYSKNRAG